MIYLPARSFVNESRNESTSSLRFTHRVIYNIIYKMSMASRCGVVLLVSRLRKLHSRLSHRREGERERAREKEQQENSHSTRILWRGLCQATTPGRIIIYSLFLGTPPVSISPSAATLGYYCRGVSLHSCSANGRAAKRRKPV